MGRAVAQSNGGSNVGKVLLVFLVDEGAIVDSQARSVELGKDLRWQAEPQKSRELVGLPKKGAYKTVVRRAQVHEMIVHRAAPEGKCSGPERRTETKSGTRVHALGLRYARVCEKKVRLKITIMIKVKLKL